MEQHNNIPGAMMGQEMPMQATNYAYSSYNPPWKSKQQHSASDEEEINDASDGKRSAGTSPWQRMKWTDSMVRLLIMAVYYMGDESVVESEPGKKKGAGAQQKKGKWKSVSRAMLEKGFCVSPQQCEDKFNDLNKRYKRVNDILGKGTACQVVENQSLLETMELPVKMKEEARKLLNSKHLFFREMCAYHNSCGHGLGRAPAGVCSHPHSQFGEEEEDLEEESEEEEGDEEEEIENKKLKVEEGLDVERLASEIASAMQDGGRSLGEKWQWIRARMVEVEEQRLAHQWQGFELEKQRLKWVRFSGKKEREMERAKLENERKRLESERMVLLVRQKELELLETQRSQQTRADVSSFTS